MAFLEIDKRNILVDDRAKMLLYRYVELCDSRVEKVIVQFGIGRDSELRFCKEIVPVFEKAINDLKALPGYEKLLPDYFVYILAGPIGVLLGNQYVEEEEARVSAWDFIAGVFGEVYGIESVELREDFYLSQIFWQIVYKGAIEYARRTGLEKEVLERLEGYLEGEGEDYDAIGFIRKL